MSTFAFYWTGAAFMAVWVISSRDKDHEVSVFSELFVIVIWPVFAVVLGVCMIWLLTTGRLPWQR